MAGQADWRVLLLGDEAEEDEPGDVEPDEAEPDDLPRSTVPATASAALSVVETRRCSTASPRRLASLVTESDTRWTRGFSRTPDQT
jgi:hypothetical protein